MPAVMTGTLAKWGNSQGIRIPKDVCDMLGIHIGAVVDMQVNQAKNEVVLKFESPTEKYQRNRKVTMEELCAGWNGERVGEEWGGPDVGAEVVA